MSMRRKTSGSLDFGAEMSRRLEDLSGQSLTCWPLLPPWEPPLEAGGLLSPPEEPPTPGGEGLPGMELIPGGNDGPPPDEREGFDGVAAPPACALSMRPSIFASSSASACFKERISITRPEAGTSNSLMRLASSRRLSL